MATAYKKWSDYEYGRTTAAEGYTVLGATSGEEALAASGLPAINSSHPENSLLKAEQPIVRRPGFSVYEVLVRYSIPPNGEHPNPNTNPTSEPIQIEWQQGVTGEPVDRDIDGNEIVNSAHDPPETPPTRNVTEWFLTISRNEAYYDWIEASEYQDVLNSNMFTVSQPGGQTATFRPGTVKVVSILPTGRFSINAAYVNVAYKFALRAFPPGTLVADRTVAKSPFQIWMLDQGYNGYFTATKPGKFVDAAGEDASVPIRLKGNGTPWNSEIKVKSGPTTTAAAVAQALPTWATKVDKVKATFLVYKNYAAADLSALSL